MVRYNLEGKDYSFSYTEFKKYYQEYCSYSDEQFVKKLTHALHLSCIICFFKETSCHDTLGDSGLIHRLTHLLVMREQFERDGIELLSVEEISKHVKEVREQFKIICELI
jgi:hypothetical protein